VLILDDEPGIRNFLVKGLSKHLGLVESVDSFESAEEIRQRCHFDLIIADIKLPGGSGVEWIQSLRELGCNTAVIFITAHGDLNIAIEAIRASASDFIIKPFRVDQILTAIERCIERHYIERENFVLKRQVDKLIDNSGMVGDSEALNRLREVINRIAGTASTILIEGESGTGKELAARSVHQLSGRSGVFVPVNCGAISADLLESELFGHVKGSFTGAHQSREGLFSHANGGTLFLDEISEMPLPMQAHLLRVLEERVVRPVGSNKETPVDVRIIAATNRDLKMQVSEGGFRQDLYFRLNVLNLQIPPLCDRIDDLKDLSQHFIDKISASLGIKTAVITSNELSRLAEYEWPGNIRELKNVIERSLLLNMLPSACLGNDSRDVLVKDDHLNLELAHVERQHIEKILENENGNKSAAARILGVSRRTLERKVSLWESLA
jgi:DNA-binding NtrC family response regulator